MVASIHGGGRGRPRKKPVRRHGTGTYEEILDAAAEMFSAQGFAATTMNQLADAVGVGQNSIYHHFGSKLAILKALLMEGVTPGLRIAAEINDLADDSDDVKAAAGLYALALADAAVLASWRWNLGALYLLPEARSTELTEFQDARHALRRHYIDMSSALTRRLGSEAVGDQVYRLVVSIINIRWDNEAGEQVPRQLARSGLRLCGWTGSVDAVEKEARRLLTILTDRQVPLPPPNYLFAVDSTKDASAS
ncbi:TetR/AcrR family transcriptional regulator [Mycobacteroides abscessus]|uniref:TetR/AcrR family transcriptional regulator n=1 Tax=Mycobacteroides abscessus TaxID=36809 RepID=UPI0009C59967|nr:TetR/AcrR family transcriptional regulator [Mycobacteroides abscessus]SLF24494.1 Putative transcriptional regulator, TetR family [Mycobacteroides abscessus subsp. abscessus]